MAEYSITSPDLEALIGLFNRAPEITGEETKNAMNAAVRVAQEEVVKRVPVDTGRLWDAITARVEGDGAGLSGVVEVSSLVYSVPMELGSRPHWPPRAPIEAWARRKFNLSNPVEARRVGFLVARSISKKGTKGRFYFRDGAKAAEPRIERLFEAAADRIVKRINS